MISIPSRIAQIQRFKFLFHPRPRLVVHVYPKFDSKRESVLVYNLQQRNSYNLPAPRASERVCDFCNEMR